MSTTAIRAASPVTSSDAQEVPERTRPWPWFKHPLTVVCLLQALLSSTLIWSNTAFADEADYLWIGRLELAHWLHGAAWPSGYAVRLSGSPAIYPPLGALASSLGGLAGARILSLTLMLGATLLLYSTASRLFGRTAAMLAVCAWACTEPVLRLAFATYDPLSIFLTALAAWLALQVGFRRHRGELVAASALALALANMTAYSAIIMDPVVIAFAFLTWLSTIGAKQARFCAAWFIATLLIAFGLLMSLAHSWPGTTAVFNRQSRDHQRLAFVLTSIWQLSGLMIVLALLGAVIAMSTEDRRRALLVVALCGAAFAVPVAQLHDMTAWSLDKHLAYGFWFASMAAGYGCRGILLWLAGIGKRLTIVCGLVILVYAGALGWQSAWYNYRSWPSARSFVASFSPVVARTRGLIYVAPKEQHIAEYYTTQGTDWDRWSGNLSLDPATSFPALPQRDWYPYYAQQLRAANYGVIVLFYNTRLALPEDALLSAGNGFSKQDVLSLMSSKSTEPGLSALTEAIEQDTRYRLVAEGSYGAGDSIGGYAIWQKAADW